MSEQPDLAQIAGDVLEHLSILNITISRLYDVQMALLELTDPATAEMMHNAHNQGRFLGAIPNIAESPYEQ